MNVTFIRYLTSCEVHPPGFSSSVTFPLVFWHMRSLVKVCPKKITRVVQEEHALLNAVHVDLGARVGAAAAVFLVDERRVGVLVQQNHALATQHRLGQRPSRGVVR